MDRGSAQASRQRARCRPPAVAAARARRRFRSRRLAACHPSSGAAHRHGRAAAMQQCRCSLVCCSVWCMASSSSPYVSLVPRRSMACARGGSARAGWVSGSGGGYHATAPACTSCSAGMPRSACYLHSPHLDEAVGGGTRGDVACGARPRRGRWDSSPASSSRGGGTADLAPPADPSLAVPALQLPLDYCRPRCTSSGPHPPAPACRRPSGCPWRHQTAPQSRRRCPCGSA